MSAGAIRALSLELKGLKDEPLEGFRIRLPNDDNLFDWEVAIFGPPGTIYEGGYFKARMHFPADYPYSPPTVRFDKATLFHPNVYESGDLCISILHPPIDDPQSGELPCERWNPTQNVRTILLSVVSLLNEPNTSSPANVDASIMYRKWKDSKGKDEQYEQVIKRQVAQSRLEADKDGVVVPVTLEDYVVKAGPSQTKSSIDMDFYDDDDDFDMDVGDDDSSANDSVIAGPEETPSATTTNDGGHGGGSIEDQVAGNGGGGGENCDEHFDPQIVTQNHIGNNVITQQTLPFSYNLHFKFDVPPNQANYQLKIKVSTNNN